MPISLTETLNSVTSATWPWIKKELIDLVFLKKYPFFWWLSDKKRIRYIDQGRDIRFPIEYDVNSTVTELTKNGEVDITDQDPFTTVIYQWGTVAGNINAYRDDDLENRGKSQIFDLMQAKNQNLAKSMRRFINQRLYRAEDTKPAGGIESLLDLVDDTPTVAKTVGGHNQATYPWWRNCTQTATGAAGLWGRKDMQSLLFTTEDAGGDPDIILCHKNFYAAYDDELLEMKVIMNEKLADAGFRHLTYMGIPMIKDQDCPSNRLWMLDSSFLYLVIHKRMNFEMTKWKDYINQPFNRAAQVVAKMQLLLTNRPSQGTMLSITY